jgi:hypothetical protein
MKSNELKNILRVTLMFIRSRGAGSIFLRVKRLGLEDGHSSPNEEVKNKCNIIILPIYM